MSLPESPPDHGNRFGSTGAANGHPQGKVGLSAGYRAKATNNVNVSAAAIRRISSLDDAASGSSGRTGAAPSNRDNNPGHREVGSTDCSVFGNVRVTPFNADTANPAQPASFSAAAAVSAAAAASIPGGPAPSSNPPNAFFGKYSNLAQQIAASAPSAAAEPMPPHITAPPLRRGAYFSRSHIPRLDEAKMREAATAAFAKALSDTKAKQAEQVAAAAAAVATAQRPECAVPASAASAACAGAENSAARQGGAVAAVPQAAPAAIGVPVLELAAAALAAVGFALKLKDRKVRCEKGQFPLCGSL